MKQLLTLALFCLSLYSFIFSQNPGTEWMQYAIPEEAGWSTEKLKTAKDYADSIGTSAFLLIYDGKVVTQWGETERRFMCHSVRKSFLSALYGFYVDAGKINLQTKLSELGIDDIFPLSKQEKSATIQNLLQARSGVYHPAAYETEAMKKLRPERDSHKPGTFWYYNNWDFNTLRFIIEMYSQKDFFEDFKKRIAEPLQMQDFRLEQDTYYHLEAEHSKYPAYPFRMSARDMARVGQWFLQGGKWNGQQLISKEWVEESTKIYSENVRREGTGYSYLWWTGMYGNRHRNYSAQGVGNQAIIVYPDENVVMVNRANTFLGQNVATEDLVKLTELVWAARTNTASASPRINPVPNRLQEYVGTYNIRGDAYITLNDGHLTAHTSGSGKFILIPLGKDIFMAEDARYILQFKRDAEGALLKEVNFNRKSMERILAEEELENR